VVIVRGNALERLFWVPHLDCERS